MNFKKIKLVAGREFSIRVKKKSFILTTILTPLLFVALSVAPALFMRLDMDSKQDRILVVDNSAVVASNLKSNDQLEYVVSQNNDIDALKADFNNLNVDAIVAISPLDSANNVSVVAYSVKQLNADLSSDISGDIKNVIEQYKLKQYDIENFEAILADINADMSFNNLILGEDGQEKESMVEINMMISLIMGMIIYMFVAMFGNMVMTSVINEKSNKIVEVIVSSVKPFDLMMGKIIGVAAVALTQFLIWIILTLGILMGISAYAGMEMFADPQMAQQMEMMAPMGAEQMEMMTSQGAMSEVLGVITSVDWGYIIGCFLIYFILGYLLYASLFAAVGSAVENESDTNQLMIPITIPLIIGLLLMMQTFNNPDSTVSFWASMIPFTSPMVMLARVPFEGGVPTWELLLSIGILLLTIIVVVYLAAKIYRVGILMTGKKYSWKDIWTWIKY